MPRWNTFSNFLSDAQQYKPEQRQSLVDELLSERPHWPWVEGNRATFIYAKADAQQSVALNLDTIKADPPFAPMTRLEGANFWHITHDFDETDLVDYLLAVDDPMTPLAKERDVAGRISQHWRPDPLNPLKMNAAGREVSVLRMSEARPYIDWSRLAGVPRGNVQEYNFNSQQVGYQGRTLWVYTPPDYDAMGGHFPLLILPDGQWMRDPLQVPYIADALLKHRRMRPVIIAMLQSGSQEDRNHEYISNDQFYASLLLEVLPFVQSQYRVDGLQMGVGGVSAGAIAAANAALKNPMVFTSLIMISPPLGKGEMGDLLADYAPRFAASSVLPKRVFQSVGRYEGKARFVKPALSLRATLKDRLGDNYYFAETGSGHGLVGFRSILPEALAWTYPPEMDEQG